MIRKDPFILREALMQAYEYIVTTPRLAPALDIDEAKVYLKVTNTVEDTLIAMLIEAVADLFEDCTNLILVTTAFQTFRDAGSDLGLNYGRTTGGFNFELRRGNFQSLTAVNFLLDGTFTAYDFAANLTQTRRQPYACFVPKVNVATPLPDANPANVRIDFLAGFGDSDSDIPAGIQMLLQQMLMFFYQNRGDCSKEALPEMIVSQLDKYRLRSIGA